ncbi:flagellar filament capping protein FliD [Salinisphaera sp.]|uniref:flagellar filament capping protein FliD n=1 Tax=Salinisphaera sp. TaxID=1914330 RepID=UPI000C4C8AD7|nr:flagellar filament capping protein FliD [Salinisphaera sp.]MBS64210.1 flagellar filament capping protein FliD [Salinisphaera sp.]
MAITSSLGIGSGLDLSSLLDGLRSSEQQRLVPLQRQASSYNTKLSAYGTLQSSLANFQTAAEALGKASLYEGVKTTTDSDAFKAVANEKADPGSYSIEVQQLARSQSLVSAGQAGVDDKIGSGGKITLSLGDGAGNVSETVDIDLADADSSLSGIRDAINAADIGVNASIVNDGSGTPYRLVLSSNTTGTASQISVSVAENNGDGSTPLGDLLNYDSTAGSGAMNQTVAARDAKLSVNGIEIVSQTNRVEEAIEGVTLTLSKTTSEPQSLTATRDTDSVKAALDRFVKAYNSVNTLSDKLTAFDSEKEISGVLLGDSTARTAETRVRGALNTAISGGAFSSLAEIGVSLQRDGTMKIDDEKLDKALANNLADVGQLLAGKDESGGLSKVLVSTLDAVAGEQGLLQSASNGMKTRIDNLTESMEREQESIDSTIARYQKQFVQLDSIMASINSTSNYLTQQFASLNKSSD